MAVAPWIVSDELSELIEPLLPVTGGGFAIRAGSAFDRQASLSGASPVDNRGFGTTCLRRQAERESNVAVTKSPSSASPSSAAPSVSTGFVSLPRALPANETSRARRQVSRTKTPPERGFRLERTTGFEPATLSLGS